MPTRIQRRARGEDGAAMVEFAFVSVLLVLFILGIINFGLILSFKQDVTRAAAEGAREGAVELPPTSAPAGQTDDSRHAAAVDATKEAVDSFGKDCDSADGMDCVVVLHDCGTTPSLDTADLTDVSYYDNGVQDCVTVGLEYDYSDFPLLPKPPLLAGILPERIASTSVARLNE